MAKMPPGVRRAHTRTCPGTGRCGCSYGYTLKVTTPGGVRQFTKQGFATMREAKDARAVLVERYKSGTLPEADRKITVEAWLNDWLRMRTVTDEDAVRVTSAREYRRVVRDYLVPALGQRRLADLSRADVERWLRDLRADRPDLTATTRAGLYGILKSALKRAVEEGLLVVSPCASVHSQVVPKRGRSKVEPWTAAEFVAFVGHEKVAGHWMRPIILVAALTGMRRGELAGLAWSAVDLEERRINVRQQVAVVGYTTHVGKPKTEAGERTIRIDAATVDVLRKVKRQQARQQLALGEAWANTDDRVFTWPDGRPIHPERITAGFGHLVKVTGARAARFHDLRHFHASVLLAAGQSMKVISERLGHSTLTITADIYTHLSPETDQSAADAAAALIAGAS